ncbi:MAG: CdaR family protein [Trueperaceae bacterium]
MTTVFDLLDRLLIQNAPRKLGALVVAIVVWLFVATDTATIAQRSLLVPIVVEGVSAEQVVIGLPQFAEVTVSAPTTRIDRLRPESFEAVIDLAGVSGDFQQQVSVSPPQGIVLERVVPSEVIGIVEPVARAQLPVVPSVLGEAGDDLRVRATVTPAQAEVRGRTAVVAQAVAVVVPLPAGDALATSAMSGTGFAVDATGRPLPEVAIEPESFALDWDLEPVYVERTLPLEVAALPDEPWSDPSGAPAEITVVGPRSSVAALDAVVADVDLPTGDLEGGRYTLELRPRLPADVLAVESPTVDLEYTAPTNPAQ